MSNRHVAHLQILPEDDANREIANGFLKENRLIQRRIQVLPVAGGWGRALDKIVASQLEKFGERRLLLLIDFDDDIGQRNRLIRDSIPEQIKNRVYCLGVRSEPEKLRSSCKMSFEAIGNTLAAECVEGKYQLWKHELLVHNETELSRLTVDIRPFLFG